MCALGTRMGNAPVGSAAMSDEDSSATDREDNSMTNEDDSLLDSTHETLNATSNNDDSN